MAKEKTLTTLQCQICGEEISGSSEEDARKKLDKHTEETHSKQNPGSRLQPWLENTD